MIQFIRDTIVAVALVPLIIMVAMFVRHAWASRSPRERGWPWPIGRPALVFGVALVIYGLLLFAFILPLYRLLDARGYVAALTEEAGRGEIKRAAELARIALEAYPGSGELSALGTSVMLRASDCDGLRRHLVKNPAALSSQEINHRNLLTLARATRACGLPLKENPDATRLIDSLRNRADMTEESDLLQMEMGIAPGMGAAFRTYARAAPAANTVREDALIEGVTTHVGDKGRHEFVIYFRPLSDWRGRHLWVHAYPPGSHEYVDIAGDFPAFNGWKKEQLAWEVFQTPDDRAFNIYVGVAIGDDLGPAVPIGVVGGT